ncbi:MAG: hypothetical protein OIN90_12450, partial [Candidatus Methanoperedens sp.]|nr:hypothetical protein [Candidatus Methanoperedens sp.]
MGVFKSAVDTIVKLDKQNKLQAAVLVIVLTIIFLVALLILLPSLNISAEGNLAIVAVLLLIWFGLMILLIDRIFGPRPKHDRVPRVTPKIHGI